MHADVNAAFNILFIFDSVQWSKRVQSVYTLQDKAGMVLRGKIHLDACKLPPSVNDMMAGTGCQKTGDQRRQFYNRSKGRHLTDTPLDGSTANILPVRVRLYT